MKFLKPPARSIGVEVIVNRRASPLKGLLQHFTHGSMKAFETAPGNPVSPLKRPDPGPIEGLIGINISEARHERLIEKQTLDPPPPCLEKRSKRFRVPLFGLGPQVLNPSRKSVFSGRRESDCSESPHIPEEELLVGTGERKKKMRVRRQGF